MPSSQQPLGSGFTAWSTAADVIRGIVLSGKTAIVTGGYSNLGLETGRVLAGTGAQVISLHPGSTLGPLARHLTQEEIDSFGALDTDGSAVIDPDRDKKSLVGRRNIGVVRDQPATHGLGGVYCEDSDVARIMPKGSTERFGVVDRAIDPDTAKRLWVLRKP